MKHFKLKVGLVSSLLMLLVVLLAQIPLASAEPSVQDKASAFLSDVVGLDIAKYNAKIEGPTVNYGSTFGSSVKEERILFVLESKESQTRADFVFENGLLGYCSLSHIKGPAVYKKSPSTSVLEQAKAIIQKYQSYADQNFEADTSYVQSMRSMLSAVSELKSLEKTDGNIKLQISETPIDNVMSTVVKWVYTENGIDVPRKSVAIYFLNGTLSDMTDTWNLLTIGSKSLISEEEALSMAWKKAKNYTLKFASENGSTLEVKPDLSNVTTEVIFSMTTRNSTALYPLWTINFYFNKLYYNAYGIQVCIWGDTKEVFYCESLITLGSSSAGNPTATSSNLQPSGTPPAPSSPAENSPINPTAPATTSTPDTNLLTEGDTNPAVNTYLIAVIAAIGIAVAVAAVTLKKRKSK